MTIQGNSELPDVGSATEDARGASLLRQAEQRREEREKNLFLDIPSWDGDLVCEYQIIPKEELKKMSDVHQRRLKSGDFDPIHGDMDLIARACVGLYVIDPANGKREPITDEYGVVGYDRIAFSLDKTEIIRSNREAISYLMGERTDDGGWKENTVAIGMHARAISRWMKDPSKRTIDVEDLLGES